VREGLGPGGREFITGADQIGSSRYDDDRIITHWTLDVNGIKIHMYVGVADTSEAATTHSSQTRTTVAVFLFMPAVLVCLAVSSGGLAHAHGGIWRCCSSLFVHRKSFVILLIEFL
jgi:hypothetical protein